MSAPEFTGFGPETTAFLEELERNNTRHWFEANRAAYDSAFLAPGKAFASAMCRRLDDLTGHSHTSKIFRLHRDLRFSRDKTPYNTYLHIAFFPSGFVGPPGWFFGLDTQGVTVGAGVFAFEKGRLDAYRIAVDGPFGARLSATVGSLSNAGFRVSEPHLKRVPTGFPADHVHGDLLRRKGIAVWWDFASPDVATRRGFADEATAVYGKMKPFVDILLTLYEE